MSEISVEEIVTRYERHLDLRGEATLGHDEFCVLIASWRERGEALRLSRPFVNVAASPRQAEASTRWHDKAITALAAIDAALGSEPKAVSEGDGK